MASEVSLPARSHTLAVLPIVHDTDDTQPVGGQPPALAVDNHVLLWLASVAQSCPTPCRSPYMLPENMSTLSYAVAMMLLVAQTQTLWSVRPAPALDCS